MPKSIIYHQSLIENKSPHFNANDRYYLVYVGNDNADLYPALFTENDILQATLRASLNPEDAPQVKNTWFMKFLRGIGVCE